MSSIQTAGLSRFICTSCHDTMKSENAKQCPICGAILCQQCSCDQCRDDAINNPKNTERIAKTREEFIGRIKQLDSEKQTSLNPIAIQIAMLVIRHSQIMITPTRVLTTGRDIDIVIADLIQIRKQINEILEG